MLRLNPAKAFPLSRTSVRQHRHCHRARHWQCAPQGRQLRQPQAGFDDFVYIKTAESEGKVLHPTQKPIELGRYLIKTYTNPGDIVLDNACGSGSFLLSAILENRQFIGIEKNEDVLLHKVHPVDYIKICTDRIRETLKNKELDESTLFLFKEPIVEYHTINYETKRKSLGRSNNKLDKAIH